MLVQPVTDQTTLAAMKALEVLVQRANDPTPLAAMETSREEEHMGTVLTALEAPKKAATEAKIHHVFVRSVADYAGLVAALVLELAQVVFRTSCHAGVIAVSPCRVAPGVLRSRRDSRRPSHASVSRALHTQLAVG